MTALLQYNSYAIQFTHLTCLWLLTYSQNCASITTINFRTISPQNETLYYEQLLLMCPQPLTTINLLPVSIDLSLLENLIQVESYNMWPSVTGLFYLAYCFQGVVML